MADKKIAITGKVEIDQAKATADLAALREELAGFRKGMADLNTGIGLVLRSLASIAKEMAGTSAAGKTAAKAVDDTADAAAAAAKSTVDLGKAAKDAAAATEEVAGETQDTRSLWRELVEEFQIGFLDGLDQASKETQKVTGHTEILRGLWQRIGHKAIDGLVSALRGLAGYMAGLLDDANDFDATFDRMAARGVKNVDALRVAVVELAGSMGEDLLQVASSVDLAESLGAGDGAIEAARAAWENYRVTGMDVTRQIEISTRVSKAFNLEMGQQAELIRSVGSAAQRAKVDQDALWNGISVLGPRIQQLGGSYKDLIGTVNAAIASGIKIDENGPAGLQGLLDNLIKPTQEFGEALVEVGAIATESSPKWLQLNNDINGQASAFASLNVQVERYRDLATEIGLLTSQADRLVQKYQDLAQKQASGQRLNREERTALREARRAVEEQNDALAKYDDLANIVARSDFRRVDAVDQLAERSRRLKDAQIDVNLQMREAQLEADKVGNSLGAARSEFQALTATLQTEIPAAIQAAFGGDGGLGKAISELSRLPDALGKLPAAVQTFVTQLGPGISQASAAIATQVGGINQQFQTLEAGGTDAFTTLKTNIASLATQIMAPVAEAMNAVSLIIIEKLKEPFADGSTVYQRVSEWATRTAATIVTDIEAVASGDQALADVLSRWFRAALEQVRELWREFAAPMIGALQDELAALMPDFRQWLIGQFSQLAADAGNALRGSITGFIDDKVGGLFDSVFQATGGYNPSGSLAATATTSNGGYTSNSTFNISGAQDPNATADAVARRIAQQERLGYSGSRLR